TRLRHVNNRFRGIAIFFRSQLKVAPFSPGTRVASALVILLRNLPAFGTFTATRIERIPTGYPSAYSGIVRTGPDADTIRVSEPSQVPSKLFLVAGENFAPLRCSRPFPKASTSARSRALWSRWFSVVSTASLKATQPSREASFEAADAFDKIHTHIQQELVALMQHDSSTIARAVDYLIVARKLERIGDHATN